MRKLFDPLDDDAVAEVLRSLRVRSTVYCRSEMTSPWGFGVGARDISAFHLVTTGSCWLEVDDLDDEVHLEAGDLALLMTGRGHRVRDNPASKVEWLDDILAGAGKFDRTLRHGGGGDVTELVCGGFVLEGAQANPLLHVLPPLIRFEGRDPTISKFLDGVLGLLHLEASQQAPGSDAVLSSLADLLLTHAIRTYLVDLAHTDAHQVAALRDPRIAKAVHLAHAQPGHPWTVDELATEVAMSRSAFAAKFRQLTGESPMRYVTRCRLARAAAYLAEDVTNLHEIATQVGYDSEASFTRAFTRTYGMAPGAYRKRLNQTVDYPPHTNPLPP